MPKRQRYGGKDGRIRERAGQWRISSMTTILHNPMYKGEGVLDSQYGRIERPAPALVDAQTWQRAQDALKRNRCLSTKNAKNSYLLRGLVRCDNCGHGYTGTTTASTRAGELVRSRRYRCNSQVSSHDGHRRDATTLPLTGSRMPSGRSADASTPTP